MRLPNVQTASLAHQARLSRTFWAAEIPAVLTLVLFVTTIASPRALAGSLTTLYSFTGGPDGASPQGNLLMDAAGNIYGTTPYGGSSSAGIVFKLDSSGHETVLYSFAAGADGSGPFAGVIMDAAHNLYGTTDAGGSFNGGTVFKLDSSGHETVLYNIGANPNDGAGSFARLVRDTAGNFYGTSPYGNLFDGGTVFKLDPTGHETVLHDFTGFPTDGLGPYNPSGLIRDAAGNLYGTTTGGWPFSVHRR